MFGAIVVDLLGTYPANMRAFRSFIDSFCKYVRRGSQSCFVPQTGQCANQRRMRDRHRRQTFVRPRL